MGGMKAVRLMVGYWNRQEPHWIVNSLSNYYLQRSSSNNYINHFLLKPFLDVCIIALSVLHSDHSESAGQGLFLLFWPCAVLIHILSTSTGLFFLISVCSVPLHPIFTSASQHEHRVPFFSAVFSGGKGTTRSPLLREAIVGTSLL